MIVRYAIRKKSTGEFLGRYRSRYYSYQKNAFMQGRLWVKHVNDADLWYRSSDAISAAKHTSEIKEWSKTNGRVRGWHIRQYDTCPIEIVEFNVLLIDAKKGFIG